MNRNRYPTSQDMFQVVDAKGIPERQQVAIVELYGYSLPNLAAEDQPFITETKWRNTLKLKPYVIDRLWKNGLIERKQARKWDIRLTPNAFANVGKKV